jgi:FkbM family methyltransferase
MDLPPGCGGYRFRCDLRDAIASEVCFTGRYEPQETALVKAVLAPGMSFVDVGANWGYFTLLAAHQVGPSGRVLGLEPDPRLFKLLTENVEQNGLHQVVTLQIAAADQPGTMTLAGYDDRGGNFGLSRLTRQEVGTQPFFSVTGQPLDTLFEQQNLSAIHLLKMDIEGAEGFALAGLAQSLAQRRVRRLLLELHPVQLAEHGHSPASVLGKLTQAGYRIWAVDHSRSASRHAAYATGLDPRSLLRPLQPQSELGNWPHVFCAAPGLDLLP